MNILDTSFCADGIVPCDAPFDCSAGDFFNYLNYSPLGDGGI